MTCALFCVFPLHKGSNNSFYKMLLLNSVKTFRENVIMLVFVELRIWSNVLALKRNSFCCSQQLSLRQISAWSEYQPWTTVLGKFISKSSVMVWYNIELWVCNEELALRIMIALVYLALKTTVYSVLVGLPVVRIEIWNSDHVAYIFSDLKWF